MTRCIQVVEYAGGTDDVADGNSVVVAYYLNNYLHLTTYNGAGSTTVTKWTQGPHRWTLAMGGTPLPYYLSPYTFYRSNVVDDAVDVVFEGSFLVDEGPNKQRQTQLVLYTFRDYDSVYVKRRLKFDGKMKGIAWNPNGEQFMLYTDTNKMILVDFNRGYILHHTAEAIIEGIRWVSKKEFLIIMHCERDVEVDDVETTFNATRVTLYQVRAEGIAKVCRPMYEFVDLSMKLNTLAQRDCILYSNLRLWKWENNAFTKSFQVADRNNVGVIDFEKQWIINKTAGEYSMNSEGKWTDIPYAVENIFSCNGYMFVSTKEKLFVYSQGAPPRQGVELLEEEDEEEVVVVIAAVGTESQTWIELKLR